MLRASSCIALGFLASCGSEASTVGEDEELAFDPTNVPSSALEGFMFGGSLGFAGADRPEDLRITIEGTFTPLGASPSSFLEELADLEPVAVGSGGLIVTRDDFLPAVRFGGEARAGVYELTFRMGVADRELARGLVIEVDRDLMLRREPAQADVRLGTAVAIWEDVIVAGFKGGVVGFVREGPDFEAGHSLPAVGEVVPDDFGAAVAVRQDRILVGAPSELAPEPRGGSVHVYERTDDEWTKLQVLDAEPAEAGDRFGVSLGLFEGGAVVGGFEAAYAYRQTDDGFELEQELELPQRDFGARRVRPPSVAGSGDRIVVGVPWRDFTYPSGAVAVQAGSVVVFSRDGDGWETEAELFGPAPKASEQFGSRVAINGQRVVASMDQDVFVFTRTDATWSEPVRLLADDAIDSGYGEAVAIRGNQVLVGAPLDSPRLTSLGSVMPRAGAVYRFQFEDSKWLLDRRYVAVDGQQRDQLGWSVAMSDTVAVVGAPADDVVNGSRTTEDAGTVHAYFSRRP